MNDSPSLPSSVVSSRAPSAGQAVPAVSDAEALRNIPLFHELTAEQLREVDRLLLRRRFRTGTRIITAGEPGETIFVVYQGAVKVFLEPSQTLADDAETGVILAILGPGQVFGEMSLIDNRERSAHVEALEDSILLWADRAAFLGALQRMPALTLALTAALSCRIRLADAQIRALASMDVQGRVALQLLTFAREYGEKQPDGGVRIGFRLTQREIAGLVGASRVRVNQILAPWRRRGWIAIAPGQRITIANAAALSECCR